MAFIENDPYFMNVCVSFVDPDGPPENVLPNDQWIDQGQVGFSWQPPIEEDQNGVITHYEYELDLDSELTNEVGPSEEWPDRGITPDTVKVFIELPDDTSFKFRVRAFTSAGPGPFSGFALAKTPPPKPSSTSKDPLPVSTPSSRASTVNPMAVLIVSLLSVILSLIVFYISETKP